MRTLLVPWAGVKFNASLTMLSWLKGEGAPCVAKFGTKSFVVLLFVAEVVVESKLQPVEVVPSASIKMVLFPGFQTFQ